MPVSQKTVIRRIPRPSSKRVTVASECVSGNNSFCSGVVFLAYLCAYKRVSRFGRVSLSSWRSPGTCIFQSGSQAVQELVRKRFPKTPPAEPRNQTQPRAGILGGGRQSVTDERTPGSCEMQPQRGSSVLRPWFQWGNPPAVTRVGCPLRDDVSATKFLCFTHCSAAMGCLSLGPGAWQEFVSWGAFPGFTEVVRDRTETRRKCKVAGGLVARYEPDDSELRSWRVLAGANRRDCLVRIPNRFCRSFRLSRNDEIASRIVARGPF